MPFRPKKYGCHGQSVVMQGTSLTSAWSATGLVVSGVEAGETDRLLGFPAEPQGARQAHPTPEHLMPLYVALGAGGGKGRALHRSFSWGSIGMTTFAFGEGDKAAA